MGTTQIQNIDILFGTIILFGFIILFAMAFGFVWLQDRIYDKCREMRNEIRETNNKIFKENLETRNKIFAESQEIKKEIRETDNKIYTESREIKDEIINKMELIHNRFLESNSFLSRYKKVCFQAFFFLTKILLTRRLAMI